MDNPSFKRDESLPRQNVKLQNTNHDTVFSGIFAWREIIQGIFSKHPKSVNVGTVLTIGAVFHAYFFYCLYRYTMQCYIKSNLEVPQNYKSSLTFYFYQKKKTLFHLDMLMVTWEFSLAPSTVTIWRTHFGATASDS